MSVDVKDVASTFQITGHRVSEFTVFSNKIEGESEHTLHFDLDFETNEQNAESEKNGSVQLVVNCSCRNEAHELFCMTLKIIGDFVATSEMGNDLFHNMLEVNGLTVLIQIARTFLLTSTSLWGVGPSVVLPMINVPELINSKKQECAHE